MSIKKVLLQKKVQETVVDIFPKTSADVVVYGDSTVAAALAGFATDMKEYYKKTEADAATKKACDDLYNKILGKTDADTTINEAYDTLKEVADWIDQHGDVAAGFTTDITALKKAVGDENSGLVKGLAEAKAAIASNDTDISNLQTAVKALQDAVGDATKGLTKTVTDQGKRIAALEGTVGDASSGLVKDVEDLKAVGSVKVEKSETNGNIKINGTETNVYTHPETHAATMITEDDTHKFVTKGEKDIIANAAAVVFATSAADVTNENNLYMLEIQ